MYNYIIYYHLLSAPHVPCHTDAKLDTPIAGSSDLRRLEKRIGSDIGESVAIGSYTRRESVAPLLDMRKGPQAEIKKLQDALNKANSKLMKFKVMGYDGAVQYEAKIEELQAEVKQLTDDIEVQKNAVSFLRNTYVGSEIARLEELNDSKDERIDTLNAKLKTQTAESKAWEMSFTAQKGAYRRLKSDIKVKNETIAELLAKLDDQNRAGNLKTALNDAGSEIARLEELNDSKDERIDTLNAKLRNYPVETKTREMSVTEQKIAHCVLKSNRDWFSTATSMIVSLDEKNDELCIALSKIEQQYKGKTLAYDMLATLNSKNKNEIAKLEERRKQQQDEHYWLKLERDMYESSFSAADSTIINLNEKNEKLEAALKSCKERIVVDAHNNITLCLQTARLPSLNYPNEAEGFIDSLNI